MGDSLMQTLSLTVTLLSDGEPGSGFGAELTNAWLPRDAQGRPCVPASHLKGLLRERLVALAELRQWAHVVGVLLGERGRDGNDGRLGRLWLSDLVAHAARPLTITRTAVGKLGAASATSLRTSEALPAGTCLQGTLRLDAPAGDPLDELLRLGLMSIEALGAGRTRGAGRCRIEIAGETRGPGEVLRQVDAALRAWQPAPRDVPVALAAAPRTSEPARWYSLVFEADSPVCCPELPLVETNVLRTGLAIPASAVQGALLTRLDRDHPALATRCLLDPRFRAWPLLPSARPGEALRGGSPPTAVRVDLAHRTSKLGGHEPAAFCDAAVEPQPWNDLVASGPMKASDGVLRRWRDGHVELWRAQDMPRVVSAHGVHDQVDARQAQLDDRGRTLFTVEALAPLVFTGLVALPAEAAEPLLAALANDPHVSFGKARSVRGAGRLCLTPLPNPAAWLDWRLPDPAHGRVFIAQSPLALPDDWEIGRAETAFERLAQQAGWGRVRLSDELATGSVARTMATCGVRFGWNRHQLGTRASGHAQRLRARRVILPGSVLVLEEPLDDLVQRLLVGLGDGREQGYGALLPHPGIAHASVCFEPELPRILSRDDAGRAGHVLWKAAGEHGPTPSQIGAIEQHVARAGRQAIARLQNLSQRPARVSQRWERVSRPLIEMVEADPGAARRALRVWQDLAIAQREERHR
jgi:hypothetical protein